VDLVRLLVDPEMAVENVLGHGCALLFIWVFGSREGVPPVASDHHGDFCPGGGVLASDTVGVEDDTECHFGILLEGDGARDEVPESLLGEQVRVLVVEVYNHHGDGVDAC